MAIATGGSHHEQSSDDKFAVKSLQFIAWARQNTHALILGLAAIGILASGVVYYLSYRAQVDEAASANLQNVRFELAAGNTSQSIESLRTYLARFGSTRYGTEARILLAHALLLEGRAGEAIAPAREASAKLGKDPLAARSAFLLAAAYEQTGDTLAAIQAYTEIGRKADLAPERIRGYEDAALLSAARGERAEARALYNELLELIPEDNPSRGFYEMRAAEFGAQSLTTAPNTG